MNNLDSFYLPPLPDSLANCISYMYKPDFNYDHFVKRITTDVGLTSKIFSAANSQFFSQGAAATSNLKTAIVRIGSNNLLKILTNEYYKMNFSMIDLDFFTIKELNLHSSYVSHLSVFLADHLKIKDPNDLMIAGLYHDIGLIARCYCDKENMKILVTKCKVNKIDFYTAEKSESLPPHDKIGKQIAEKWNFNERVQFLIEHHHTPEMQRPVASDFSLYRELDILVFADIIAHRMKYTYANYLRETKVSQYFLDRLGLNPEIVAKAANQTLKAISSFDF